MVTFGWLDQLGEPSGMLAPIESASVNDYTGDRGAMPSNPFGGTVDDDICSVGNRTAEITSCCKGVINLELSASKTLSLQSIPYLNYAQPIDSQ